MTQRFNTEETLKTRQFIEFDQVNTEQKIKAFKEEPKKRLRLQKLSLLKQLFNFNGGN